MNKKQILRYIKKEMDSLENREMIEWIRNNPENHKKFNIIKAEYVASSFKEIPNSNNDFFFERFKNNIKKRKSSKIIYAAVSLVVLFALIWNFQPIENRDNILPQEISKTNSNKESQEVSFVTERGDKKEVFLPDGSKITLNVDSELTYPKEFNNSIREVTLVGEAFFDIKRNVNKPFIVNANNIKIKVLGTSFNVKSYDTDKKMETTLVTGKVELIKDKETPIILAPSQKAVFHKKKNTIKIEEVNASDVIAWKKGKLFFDKTPLQEVVVDLERKYNVSINIKSQKLLNYEYTGTFDNLNIDEVLKMLTISSPIKYNIKGEKIILE